MSYADIARDLDVYGFAAMLYWNLLTAVKPEDYGSRELLEDFLYCLEQLGVKDLKENFRGDHAAAFARIKAERQKRVKAGPGTDEKAQPPEPSRRRGSSEWSGSPIRSRRGEAKRPLPRGVEVRPMSPIDLKAKFPELRPIESVPTPVERQRLRAVVLRPPGR